MSNYAEYKSRIRELFTYLKIDKNIGIDRKVPLFRNCQSMIEYDSNGTEEKLTQAAGRLILSDRIIGEFAYFYDPFHLIGAFTRLNLFLDKSNEELAKLLLPNLEKEIELYKKEGRFLF